MKRLILLVALGGAALFGLLVLGLTQGRDEGLSELLSAKGDLGLIVWDLRMPRLLGALLVGAALSVAGYLLQLLVQNPLADPFVLGTAAGAGLGAQLCYAGILPLALAGIYLPPWIAFVFGLAVTLAVMRLAWKGGRFIGFHLIIGGFAAMTFIASVAGLLLYLTDRPDQMRAMVAWGMGSLERVGWPGLLGLALVLVATLVGWTLSHKPLVVLMLGEERAGQLGVRVARMKLLLILTSTLLVGFAVAQAGPIGFVGLIVPHFVRAVSGTTKARSLLLSALFGGVFLLACEVVSRAVYPPVGFPVGQVTALLGLPFFVYLLAQRRYTP